MHFLLLFFLQQQYLLDTLLSFFLKLNLKRPVFLKVNLEIQNPNKINLRYITQIKYFEILFYWQKLNELFY